MVAVITFSIVFNIPRYVYNRMARKPDWSLKADYAHHDDHVVYLIVYSILYYIFIYFLPAVILAIMTYRLYSDLWWTIGSTL